MPTQGLAVSACLCLALLNSAGQHIGCSGNGVPSSAELQASLTEEQQARARDSEHSLSRREEAEAAQQRLQEAMQAQVAPAALQPGCILWSEAAHLELQDAVEGSLLPFACNFHRDGPSRGSQECVQHYWNLRGPNACIIHPGNTLHAGCSS